MSDEYTSGYKGSLVNPSLNEAPNNREQPSSTRKRSATQEEQSKFDYKTQNYPSSGDSTSEGGYGFPENVWSGRAQRGNSSGFGTYRDVGLTDQGKNGEPLRDQFDDYDLEPAQKLSILKSETKGSKQPYPGFTQNVDDGDF